MMIAEEYLKSSRLLRRLKNGIHGQLVELYAASLVEAGLSRPGRRTTITSPPTGAKAIAAMVDRVPRGTIHPFHAFLLAGAVPLFLGALLSDVAYSQSYQIQWSDFASWLIAGALVIAGFSMLWVLVDLFSASRRGNRAAVYFVPLLATWVLGFINALEHAKVAWAIMPTSLVRSVTIALLVCAAAWFGLATVRVGGAT